ncbi:MAG: hypothetical protein FJ128_12785 [Deltaproteobacteria bacterium]|nr:hypothetical protein [Deltaproteobacteria bacterium]
MLRVLLAAVLAVSMMPALLPAPATATAQFPDLIFIEGRKHELYSNPLEKYFGPGNPRPKFRSPHTANWRGYIATWEIDGNMLYLKDLTAWTQTGEVGMEFLFPGQPGRVAATWFTGTLRVPQGKVIQPVHMGYLTVHKRDLILTIDQGRVVKQEIIHNTPGVGPPPLPR